MILQATSLALPDCPRGDQATEALWRSKMHHDWMMQELSALSTPRPVDRSVTNHLTLTGSGPGITSGRAVQTIDKVLSHQKSEGKYPSIHHGINAPDRSIVCHSPVWYTQ